MSKTTLRFVTLESWVYVVGFHYKVESGILSSVTLRANKGESLDWSLHMKKISFQEKISANKIAFTNRTIRNAKRGAAKPYTLYEAHRLLSQTPNYQKMMVFNIHVGKLFPLVLDLIANGYSIRKVEKTIGLNKQGLHRWLQRREVLMEMVRSAKGLRGSRVLSDWSVFDPPARE